MRLFPLRRPEPPPRYLVVGLGNPGAEYAGTRHNVGFRVVDRLADRLRIRMRRSGRAAVGRGTCGDAPVVLARPLTYMNLSGEATAPLARALGLTPAEVLVVVDDMDLPLGRIRIRKEGGAGGHNGLRSLIRYLGTQEFPRVRIGVGRPAESGVDHVLGAFSREELEPVREAVERAADAVELVLTEGIETAMNRVNAG